jgi:glucosamine--fructose-6-phosphate aminotransferase (isomerizing)
MCGIVAYLGDKPAYPILIGGLQRLEYRGYDSAGIATLEPDSRLRIEKKKGKVADLIEHIDGKLPVGTIGIGHTRWATHGPPNDVNAHPHACGTGRIAVIHNGIIENYATLKEGLRQRGHRFLSETDTEVLAHPSSTPSASPSAKCKAPTPSRCWTAPSQMCSSPPASPARSSSA